MVGSMESAPVYAEPGWLLYARQGVLAAQPFDAGALRVTGEAVPLGDEPTSILDPATSFTAGHSTSVSSDGIARVFSSPSVNTTPTWFDAAGGSRARSRAGRPVLRGPISPDGTRAILVRSTSVDRVVACGWWISGTAERPALVGTRPERFAGLVARRHPRRVRERPRRRAGPLREDSATRRRSSRSTVRRWCSRTRNLVA